MASLETTPTASDSFHLPQHTQLYHDHHQQHARTLEVDDDNNNDITDPTTKSETTTTATFPPPTTTPETYSCIPPSPQIKSYFNPLTNKTQYLPIEVNVHEIGILFNYEIRHADDVKWEKEEDGDGDGGLGGILDDAKESISGFYEKGKDFLGGLFGGDDDDEDDEEEEEGESGQEEEGEEEETEDTNDNSSQSNENINNDNGEQHLLSVEQRMVSEIWRILLEDEKMTWDLESKLCAGLVIEDDGMQRLLSTNGTGVEEGYASSEIDMEVEDNSVTGVEGMLENNTASEVEGDGNNVTQLEGTRVEDVLDTVDSAGDEDILDTVDTKFTTFSGTKLLGMTYRPLDYVNPDGCLIPDTTCTAIRGRVSAAYSGADEYGVVRTVIEHLRTGMDSSRAFLPPGSPALNVEFTSAGGTAPSGGNGQIISLNTDRGMGEEDDGDVEGDLSQYGTAFVCLVGILGAGFLAAMYVRYRKRQRRMAKEMMMDGGVQEFEEGDYEGGLEVPQATETGGSSEPDPDSHVVQVELDEPDSHVIQVELDVPQVDSNTDSNEVEITLSGSKTFD
mmetsp:Transcript_24538/g.47018  ORF Transcript_24538/g.47018 Transcript_24538/m.47018 type:complete len:562 (+) Transcript_24538:321-2006(+)